MASTTNGPLFDLQYLSYIGDLKARNKMCLRPIDIAKMHGYKDCVNYLATLEACLSLAEQNVALETELLHYGAELSELEKCFNELLQLTKSERLQAQSSYFNSVVEAIERKWKRCKSKSLGSHGLPDQSAYNLFQSHFSRVLTDDVLSELSFSSSPSNHLHHQSFFQQHLHNRFSNHRHHNHPTIDAHRLKSNPGADNLTSLLTGDRTTVKNKCNSSGYTPTYSDPFLELSNGHYSLFSSDTDYAVPYKLKTGPKNKAGVKKSDNPVILGRRGLKQQRDQPEGSSVPSYPKSSSSLYESYKDHHNHHREPSSSASSPPSASRHGKGDFEDIDLDLDLDDEDDDELSGYSSLKLRPSPQTSSSSGSKGSSSSNRPILDQVDGQHSSEPKESSRRLIATTENLSEPESKTSDGRESSINGSVSTKENYSGVGESDSASVSRKRGFLHKFNLRKWATSTGSKPKKSYSKETLLRSTGGEGMLREEVSDEGKGSSNETSSNDGGEKDKSCKPPGGKSMGGNKKESNNWWPSSHEIQSKDISTYEKDIVGTKKIREIKSTESTNYSQSNKIFENSSTSSTVNSTNFKETCQSNNLVNSSSKLSSDKRVNNHVNNENTDKHQKQVSPKGVDRSQSPINKSKVNYCRLTNDKIRSASMEAIDINPEANNHHYQVNTDNYSLIVTKPSTSVIKESKLIGRSSSKPTNDKNDINNDTIDSVDRLPSNHSPIDESTETLTSAQSVPILSNSVYGVKHVKKAKIKELSPLNYEELTPTSNPPPPSPSIGNIATSSKFFENRKKMFEKGPGNKNTRGLRRRRNGNRAWYDVSDDEDGLVTQKFNREKIPEAHESVEC